MDEKTKTKETEQAKRDERELDEGLSETFPASDPAASTQPGHGRPEPEKKPRK